LLLLHYFTLWPWLLTFDLEHLQRFACDIMKLCTKFERSRAIRCGVIAILVFDLMTFNIASCCALLWIIFTKFDLQQFFHAWIIAFLGWYVMLRCDLYLSPVDLESSGTSSVTWSECVRNLNKIEQSPAELLIILRIFPHVMSRCDLDLWPLDLEL